MGEFSIWHWTVVFLYIGFIGIPLWRIASKAGFSGWWSIAAHIPGLNLIALWVFAFAKWPKTQD